MNEEDSRILLVCLDALPEQLLNRWIADGSLPNIAALNQRARRGRVSSVADLFPGAVWPSFASTQQPTSHGIYHFMQWDPQLMRFHRPSPEWLDYRPF